MTLCECENLRLFMHCVGHQAIKCASDEVSIFQRRRLSINSPAITCYCSQRRSTPHQQSLIKCHVVRLFCVCNYSSRFNILWSEHKIKQTAWRLVTHSSHLSALSRRSKMANCDVRNVLLLKGKVARTGLRRLLL